MATRVRSFCKINLGLAVGPLRPDGFHPLTTVYQTIALHDVVTVQARASSSTRITIEASHPGVPCTSLGNCERNTAYKIVAGALSRLGMSAEVRLQIEKNLPVQGGLGAGSANAAAALLGLERELDTALAGAERLALAAEVGSDVPLFLLGGTVLGVGRGETVSPLPDGDPLPVVVAVPDVGVSTPQAFRDLDAQMASGQSHPTASGLTQTPPIGRLKQLSHVVASAWTPTGARRETTGIAKSSLFQPAGERDLLQSSGAPREHGSEGDLAENTGSLNRSRNGGLHPLLALVRTGVENDFESVAFRQHPSLQTIKRALLGDGSGFLESGASGALYAALSGSGSALFGIYGSPEAAREAQQRVQSLGTRAFLTETLPRSTYWQRMFA